MKTTINHLILLFSGAILTTSCNQHAGNLGFREEEECSVMTVNSYGNTQQPPRFERELQKIREIREVAEDLIDITQKHVAQVQQAAVTRAHNQIDNSSRRLSTKNRAQNKFYKALGAALAQQQKTIKGLEKDAKRLIIDPVKEMEKELDDQLVQVLFSPNDRNVEEMKNAIGNKKRLLQEQHFSVMVHVLKDNLLAVVKNFETDLKRANIKLAREVEDQASRKVNPGFFNTRFFIKRSTIKQ